MKNENKDEPKLFKNSASNILDLPAKKAVFNGIKERIDLILNPVNGRSETFDEAFDRLGLAEDDLEKIQYQLKFASRLLYSSAAGCIIIGLYYALNDAALAVASSLCVAMMFVSYAAPRAMRHWQVKNRSMCSFRDWIKNPENWFI